MPIYPYHCEKCRKDFEQTRPMSESGETAKCPDCGDECKRRYNGVNTQRLFPGSYAWQAFKQKYPLG